MKRACRIIPLLVGLVLIFLSVSSSGLFNVITVYDGDTFKAEGYDIDFGVGPNYLIDFSG